MAILISKDIRSRMMRGIAAGKSARAVARQFEVAPSTASRLKRHVEETGSIAPRPQGKPKGSGKLEPYRDFLIAKVLEKPDITMPELARVLQAEHDVTADPSTLSKLLCAAGFTYKKTLLAAEQERADVKAARADWKHYRQPAMQAEPGRLIFLDETSVKTNMCRLRGRSLCGTRLKASAPFGKWGTQTFVAGLRCGELTAPWIIEGAMNRAAFDTYIEHVLAPTLSPGDVVILDNLSVHHSPRAADILAERGAWFLYLPKYSPDLNPIEMAFSKLKAHLRAAAARNFNDLASAIGDICNLFTPAECWNFFKAANYVAE